MQLVGILVNSMFHIKGYFSLLYNKKKMIKITSREPQQYTFHIMHNSLGQ